MYITWEMKIDIAYLTATCPLLHPHIEVFSISWPFHQNAKLNGAS